MESIPSDSPQGKHYVYTLAYPDGKVFYVGKGVGRRIHKHAEEAKRGVKSHKCSIIRKILDGGEHPLKTILAYFETDSEAKQYEMALIFFMDGLANLTIGGEGANGYTHTADARKRIGESSKARPITKEMRQKMALSMKGHQVSEVTRQKISETAKGKTPWMKGRTHTEETRRKISETGKGRTPPNKGKPGKPHSEEQKRHMSEIMKGRPRSEEYRRNISLAHRGKKRSEQAIRNITEANRRNAEKKRKKHQLEFTEMPEASGE